MSRCFLQGYEPQVEIKDKGKKPKKEVKKIKKEKK